MGKFIIAVLLLVGVGVGYFLLKGTPSSPQQETPEFLHGVTLTPKSFSGTEFTDFFTKAKEVGNAISWSGDWVELEKTEGGGPNVLVGLAKTYNYTPIVIVQFFTQDTGKLLRPLDDATKARYKQAAANFAKNNQLGYLGLGIEINILYEKSPSDFDSFVGFYSEVYDAVKAASPSTKVFTIFQLEKMKGLGGGLFGGVNDEGKNEWALLGRFPKNDLAVFTTYPDLIYKNPADIPDAYYSEIKSRTDRTVAFTEIGWHSASSPKGWESSEEEQASYIERYFTLTSGLGQVVELWSFMYDQNTIVPFNSMGLIKADGTAKSAFTGWKK